MKESTKCEVTHILYRDVDLGVMMIGHADEEQELDLLFRVKERQNCVDKASFSTLENAKAIAKSRIESALSNIMGHEKNDGLSLYLSFGRFMRSARRCGIVLAEEFVRKDIEYRKAIAKQAVLDAETMLIEAETPLVPVG